MLGRHEDVLYLRCMTLDPEKSELRPEHLQNLDAETLELRLRGALKVLANVAAFDRARTLRGEHYAAIADLPQKAGEGMARDFPHLNEDTQKGVIWGAFLIVHTLIDEAEQHARPPASHEPPPSS